MRVCVCVCTVKHKICYYSPYWQQVSAIRPSSGHLNTKFKTGYMQKGKVKCTLVQALRLCTGRTVHRGSRGIAVLLGKGKVHPCTGTEALYRPYGP